MIQRHGDVIFPKRSTRTEQGGLMMKRMMISAAMSDPKKLSTEEASRGDRTSRGVVAWHETPGIPQDVAAMRGRAQGAGTIDLELVSKITPPPPSAFGPTWRPHHRASRSPLRDVERRRPDHGNCAALQRPRYYRKQGPARLPLRPPQRPRVVGSGQRQGVGAGAPAASVSIRV
jgi:hypothetical protein